MSWRRATRLQSNPAEKRLNHPERVYLDVGVVATDCEAIDNAGKHRLDAAALHPSAVHLNPSPLLPANF